MALKLYNTLTRKNDIFKPIKKEGVGIYTCGPTVYNYAHIGNLRTYIFNDLLKRSLLFLGYKVKHVMNITDVDDKTIRESAKNKGTLKEFTRKYEKVFFQDLENLNILKPDYILRATENIPEMVKIIKTLLSKGFAYKTSDGIYFSISKFKNYGQLAKLEKIKKLKSRVNADEYDKANPQDFALWKFYTKEDGDVFWNTDIGKGRPGWHIECSAMSMKVLGSNIDIHTGATDLIFPHHTNEIAQSEAFTGKKFVNYWLHAGFLLMSQGKMSKSLGNVLYLKDLIDKGFSPIDYRYLCLTTHYRDILNFSIENLEAAKNSYQRLKNIAQELKDDDKINYEYLEEFKSSIENDLDIPNALQVLWKLVRDEKALGKLRTIKKMDEVFGLNLLEKEKTKIPSEVSKLVKERDRSRKNKDWKNSDILREKIKKLGFTVEDTDDGSRVRKL
ncbi:MAG: cysteine--tRNA ligase [Nanoarchaeota archaeon]